MFFKMKPDAYPFTNLNAFTSICMTCKMSSICYKQTWGGMIGWGFCDHLFGKSWLCMFYEPES